MHETLFVKGFKIDHEKIANCHLSSSSDPKVHSYIDAVVRLLNRDGYKYIGGVYGHENRDEIDMVVVLEEGFDKDELMQRDLGIVDKTIEWAKPYVLTGPDVWKLWE